MTLTYLLNNEVLKFLNIPSAEWSLFYHKYFFLFIFISFSFGNEVFFCIINIQNYQVFLITIVLVIKKIEILYIPFNNRINNRTNLSFSLW